jgi:hypothetical protein
VLARLRQLVTTRFAVVRRAETFVRLLAPALRRREPDAPAKPAVPRIEYVRGHSAHAQAAVPASFAPSERPMVAAGTRPPVQQAPEIERVVRELHERLSVRLERTIHEQVQKRFASTSRFTRGLADRIQSELYHDIVFERERLGLRGAP